MNPNYWKMTRVSRGAISQQQNMICHFISVDVTCLWKPSSSEEDGNLLFQWQLVMCGQDCSTLTLPLILD